MKKQDVQRKAKKHMSTVQVHFWVTPHMSAWIKKENISPRMTLIEVCKELGYKPNED